MRNEQAAAKKAAAEKARNEAPEEAAAEKARAEARAAVKAATKDSGRPVTSVYWTLPNGLQALPRVLTYPRGHNTYR